MIQRLLVTPERFAEIACMDGRAFGVITYCERCDYSLNPCLRSHLLDALAQNQERSESLLGYSLTTQYHEEEILWDGKSRLQLSRSGIEAINVRQSQVSWGSFEISPYVMESVSPEDRSGLCVLVLDGDYIDNPRKAVIRDAVTGSVIQTQNVSGYPKKNGDGNWEVALDDVFSPCSSTFNVSHCHYMALTTEVPLCGGEVVAVFPNTEQIIPFAKPPTISGSDVTYWFYAWSLIDPAFRDDEEIDLLNGEFYKLIDEVELICVKDTYAPPVVTEENCDCLCRKKGKKAPEQSPDVNLFVKIGTPKQTPQPNDVIEVSIRVSNYGTDAGHSIELTTSIGDGYGFRGFSATQGNYEQPLTWEIGTILPGQSADLVLSLEVLNRGDYEILAEITNLFGIEYNQDDNNDLVELEPEDYGIDAVLLTSKSGVVSLCVSDEWRFTCNKPIKIKIFYKTSPQALGVSTSAIEEGITYLTAAELPTASCECQINEKSFIAEAQKPYTDIRINPVTGVTYAPLKFGNLHGHLVFAERLAKAKKINRLVLT